MCVFFFCVLFLSLCCNSFFFFQNLTTLPLLHYWFSEHCRGNFVIVTNDKGAADYKIVQTSSRALVGRGGGEGGGLSRSEGGGGCGRETWSDLYVPEVGCKVENIRMLAYADACWRMLTYADVF